MQVNKIITVMFFAVLFMTFFACLGTAVYIVVNGFQSGESLISIWIKADLVWKVGGWVFIIGMTIGLLGVCGVLWLRDKLSK